MRTKRLEASLAALTPAVVGYREGLPYISPEKVARESISHLQRGGARLILILKVVIFFFNVLSLLTQGRLLKNLDREKQDKFLEKRSRSRLLAIRGLAMILKLPLAMHYYTQDEVCLVLGYDREEMCADAEKHQVTR